MKIYKLILISLFIVLTSFINLFSYTESELKNRISKTTDNKSLIFLYKELTKTYLEKGDTLAINSANQLLDLSSQLNSDIDLAISYGLLGLSYKNTNYVYNSIEYFLKEKELREHIQDKYGLAECLKNLGEQSRRFFDYNTSKTYLFQSLEIFKELKNQKGIAEVLNRLAAIYTEYDVIADRNKSQSYALASNDIAVKIGDVDLQISNLILIGANFAFLKYHELSINNLMKALDLIATRPNQIDKSLILKNIATSYYYSNNFNKSIKYGTLAYEEALKSNLLVYKWLSSHILFIVYETLRIVDSAYKYLRITTDARAQIYIEEKDKALYKIENKYKEKAFEERLKQNNLYNIIYLISFISILIILTLIVLRYRNLRKINQKLQNKTEIIESQKQELSELNFTKDKFFSIIAHDLKNPLGNFKIITRMLFDTYSEFSEHDRIELLGMIKESAHNVYELIENLLEWSRTQRGVINFNPLELNLYYLIESNIKLLAPNADNKTISIHNNVNNPVLIVADSHMISTVIRNLISNAIKFTNVGGNIIITSEYEADYIKISIQDSGVGISKERIDKLFRIDTQSSTKGTNDETGTGLGLILCKEFIQKHNGKVWVVSEEGVGSSFIFTLPIIK